MWTMSQIAKDQSGPERTYLSGGQRTDQTENIFKKSFQNPKKKRTMINLRKMLVPNTPITEKFQQRISLVGIQACLCYINLDL